VDAAAIKVQLDAIRIIASKPASLMLVMETPNLPLVIQAVILGSWNLRFFEFDVKYVSSVFPVFLNLMGRYAPLTCVCP
jgi:hypothetical protein